MTRAALAALLAVPAGSTDQGGRLQADARAALRDLVRLDTSNPPGNEILAARYLRDALAKEGIASSVLSSAPSRASLVARLKGDGSRKPLILMCHTDVVPAPRGEWSVDPFGAVEKDGFLYGRGTLDVKSMCAAELAILLELKRSGARLARDIVFFAEADEESGGPDRHIDWLMREHGSIFDRAEFAINEGGEAIWRGDALAEVRVQMAEKQYVDVTLRARGPTGHSSVPRPGNAPAALAGAVARLWAHRFPARLLPPVRLFFEERAPREPPAVGAALTAVLSAAPGPELDAAAERLAALAPDYAAMLRDTLVPTILKAGFKENAVPGEAEAVLNARLLPGRRPAEFLAEVRRIAADPAVEASLGPVEPQPEAMPVDTELFRATKEAVAAYFPEARVTPYMAVWTTDSRPLRARGIITYGIDPPWMDGDGERAHGVDERIALRAFDAYTLYLRDIVSRLAVLP